MKRKIKISMGPDKVEEREINFGMLKTNLLNKFFRALVRIFAPML